MTAAADGAQAEGSAFARAALSLGVLGVVFGDIGTSPLYAFKLSVTAAGGLSEAHVLGTLSLMAWALILVVTLKYVLVIMRADNRGEGGILALTALIVRSTTRPDRLHRSILVMGLLGAALFYGDGIITPAISVLSAMEGLEVIAPELSDYVLPMATLLLVGLFLIQRRGTTRVGMLFGPIMLVWFLVLAGLGLLSVIANPGVLIAFDPAYGLALLAEDPLRAVAILGAVVLTVTGAEALYADLGHFGRRRITLAWLRCVLPALLLNYFGQGALVLSRPETLANPFYLLAPGWALVPLVILASAATIIASQAVITGAFSLTQQAVQLGYLPRLRILYTSVEAKGQIYVPLVNGLLLAGVVIVVLTFKSSDALGTAYGIAVTATMTLTAILAALTMIRVKRWPRRLVLPLFAAFLVVDLIFVGANIAKVLDGGWLPLLIASLLFFIMLTWVAGRRRLLQRRIADAVPLDTFLHVQSVSKMQRVAGTAVYLVAASRYTPTALLHNLKHNKVLHERVVVVAVLNQEEPHIDDRERVAIERLPHNFFRVTVRQGFMEAPNLQRVARLCRVQGLEFTLDDTSIFIGREKVVPGPRGGMALWRKRLFILMRRLMLNPTEFFRLPPERVIEMGGRVEI